MEDVPGCSFLVTLNSSSWERTERKSEPFAVLLREEDSVRIVCAEDHTVTTVTFEGRNETASPLRDSELTLEGSHFREAFLSCSCTKENVAVLKTITSLNLARSCSANNLPAITCDVAGARPDVDYGLQLVDTKEGRKWKPLPGAKGLNRVTHSIPEDAREVACVLTHLVIDGERRNYFAVGDNSKLRSEPFSIHPHQRGVCPQVTPTATVSSALPPLLSTELSPTPTTGTQTSTLVIGGMAMGGVALALVGVVVVIVLLVLLVRGFKRHWKKRSSVHPESSLSGPDDLVVTQTDQ